MRIRKQWAAQLGAAVVTFTLCCGPACGGITKYQLDVQQNNYMPMVL